MADQAHLLKNWKGMLEKNDFYISEEMVQAENLPSNVIKKEHFEAVEKFQNSSVWKPAPKLKTKVDKHYGKMKVGPARHFWSYKTSQAIRLMVNVYGYPKEMLTTAWFVDKICRWYDLCCSRNPTTCLSRNDEDKYNEAIAQLQGIVALMKNLQIINKFDGSRSWKPVQSGTILTTLSILDLQEIMLDSGLQYVTTAHFSSDCIENLFSSVRAVNPIPSARDFKHISKKICLCQFLKEVKSSSYNYDNSDFLAEFLDNTELKKVKDDSNEIEFVLEFVSNIENHPKLNSLDKNCLYYVLGYIISRIEKYDRHCEKCLSFLKVNSSSYVNEDINKFIIIADYNGNCLTHCDPTIFENVILPVDSAIRNLEESHFDSNKNDLALKIKKASDVLTEKINFPNCHKIKDRLLNRFIKFRLIVLGQQLKSRLEEKNENKKHSKCGSKSVGMRNAVKNVK